MNENLTRSGFPEMFFSALIGTWIHLTQYQVEELTSKMTDEDTKMGYKVVPNAIWLNIPDEIRGKPLNDGGRQNLENFLQQTLRVLTSAINTAPINSGIRVDLRNFAPDELKPTIGEVFLVFWVRNVSEPEIPTFINNFIMRCNTKSLLLRCASFPSYPVDETVPQETKLN